MSKPRHGVPCYQHDSYHPECSDCYHICGGEHASRDCGEPVSKERKNFGTILTNASAADRPDGDFYGTPSDVTQALFNFLPTISIRVWEPASGTGSMARVIEATGREVIETDLSNGQDFLETTSLLAPWIITNPPFKLAHRFIEHAARLKAQGIALLLKSQYWHASGRRLLFERLRPSYVFPLTWRPDFHYGRKGGSPTMDVLWTVWLHPYTQPTLYIPLPRPVALKQGVQPA